MDISFWSNKRVFVTGHTGFKGTWLCKILEELGSYVTGYALNPLTQPNLYELSKPNLRSVIGDIRDFDKLLVTYREAKPDIVVHMAAQPLVFESYREPRYTYETNVMGTINILECIRLTETAKSILNVTTDKVYLNRSQIMGYKENEELNGYDPYSNSKSCSELVTSSYINSFFQNSGLSVSTARSGNVIGGGDYAENRIIPDCARALSKNETIKIRNPYSIRPYQHVLDTLFAYLMILEKQYDNTSLSGAYNIGPDEDDCITSGELADCFCTAWGQGAKWENVSVKTPHEDAVLKLDCTKIKESLGWRQYWDIEQAVTKTANWYKIYYSNKDHNIEMNEQIKDFMELCK